MTQGTYPDIIKALPKVDITIEGIEAWLAQGDTFQIVFFEIQPGVIIPPHSHKAQYGMVIEGEMTLTIGDQTKRLKSGDSYYIPEGVTHHGFFHTFVRAMDYFDEPHRYKPKS
ncbi:MAG: cupin domain-containing protein [Candidatus Thorarchaeota archaeon]